MAHPIKTLTALAVAAGMGLSQAAIAQQGAPAAPRAQEVSPALNERIRDSFIFVFDEDMSRGAVEGTARSMVARAGGRLTYVYTHSIKGFAAKMPASAADEMSDDPRISYYEPDGLMFAIQSGGDDDATAQAQVTDWGVERVNGPGDGTGLGLYAFVLDTGVDLAHDDLNIASSLHRNFAADGGNSAQDLNSHGTHVAGIIAAKNNSIDTVGVAAGAEVVSVRVLDANGGGSYADIIAGVDHVAQVGLPGEVANMSLGGPKSDAVDDAVCAAAANGIFFTIAAGNSTQNANWASPARAGTCTNVYTISAIDMNDELASFSNFGNPPIICADPGVQILSLNLGGGTRLLSGTSMAAPHAAGIFLLTGGRAYNGGPVSWDRDNDPDPICVLN